MRFAVVKVCECFGFPSAQHASNTEGCKIVFFLQVVKSLLDLKDEQLAVQMDAHDSLWGETGAFLLSNR